MKEFEFLDIINKTIKNPKYLGDDCAYLEKYNLTISSDSFVEDVHFSRKYMSPYEIAKKAALSNISDILASGAKPEYITVNLSGKLNNDFIKEFYTGIDETIKQYDVDVIGGDLTASDKIMVSITAFGNTKNRNISSRKNAKHEYVIAVAGEFGSSAKGLYNLQNNTKDDYFSKIHKCPILQEAASKEISTVSKYPYAMMDSSDGLADCLFQIASKSNVSIEINYDNIPKKTDEKDFVLYGGEDYSLVAAIHKEDFKNIKNFIKIGECFNSNTSKIYVDKKEIEYIGYNHFE